ncbi:MAG: 4Fe-4S ferredoxin, partial [Schwartzia sp.]|nr:4Fe-4S ferredoxin [Schwartzia sp. (in: firmicutes)]
GENDGPILPNLGFFASFDPVAVDQASVDAAQKATPIENSQLGDNLAKPDWKKKGDHFLDSNPHVNWEETLIHAEKIGMGTREYELNTIK